MCEYLNVCTYIYRGAPASSIRRWPSRYARPRLAGGGYIFLYTYIYK